MLGFGTTDAGTGTTSRFLDPWFGARAAGTVELWKIVPIAGTVRTMYVVCTTGPATTSQTFTLRKNSVDTAVTVTLAVAATTGSDLVNSVAVVAGDQLSLRSVKNGAGNGNGARDVAITFELHA